MTHYNIPLVYILPLITADTEQKQWIFHVKTNYSHSYFIDAESQLKFRTNIYLAGECVTRPFKDVKLAPINQSEIIKSFTDQCFWMSVWYIISVNA